MPNTHNLPRDKRPALSEIGVVSDDIVNFALLLSYDLRSMEGLDRLREDVEFVKRWHTITKNLSRLALWAGGALISGLLAGISGALLANGHLPSWLH